MRAKKNRLLRVGYGLPAGAGAFNYLSAAETKKPAVIAQGRLEIEKPTGVGRASICMGVRSVPTSTPFTGSGCYAIKFTRPDATVPAWGKHTDVRNHRRLPNRNRVRHHRRRVKFTWRDDTGPSVNQLCTVHYHMSSTFFAWVHLRDVWPRVMARGSRCGSICVLVVGLPLVFTWILCVDRLCCIHVVFLPVGPDTFRLCADVKI